MRNCIQSILKRPALVQSTEALQQHAGAIPCRHSAYEARNQNRSGEKGVRATREKVEMKQVVCRISHSCRQWQHCIMYVLNEQKAAQAAAQCSSAGWSAGSPAAKHVMCTASTKVGMIVRCPCASLAQRNEGRRSFSALSILPPHD